MAKIKLTKTVVEAAQPRSADVELRDTLVPGFLCKVTPAGRKVFMIQYRTNAGERRKPSLGLFGELTVEQARALAQDWLAEVRRGGDPGGEKAEARKALTVKELCTRFMEDYSKTRNKPSTQRSYQHQIDRSIIPAFGSKKIPEVTRADVIALMKRKEKSPIQANRVLGCIRKMFNLAELWGYRPEGSNPCRHVPKYPEKGKTRLITDAQMGQLFSECFDGGEHGCFKICHGLSTSADGSARTSKHNEIFHPKPFGDECLQAYARLFLIETGEKVSDLTVFSQAYKLVFRHGG